MSSTLSNANFRGHDFGAAQCIDGETGSDGTWNFCMSNLYEAGPWLSLALPQGSTVRTVSVHARHDWGADKLATFEVWVGSVPGSPSTSAGAVQCGGMTAPATVGPHTVTCAPAPF